jgi:hypothetical protein
VHLCASVDKIPIRITTYQQVITNLELNIEKVKQSCVPFMAIAHLKHEKKLATISIYM